MLLVDDASVLGFTGTYPDDAWEMITLTGPQTSGCESLLLHRTRKLLKKMAEINQKAES